jgi:hypothetical protein
MQKFDVVSSRGVRRQLYALSKLAASRLYRRRFGFFCPVSKRLQTGINFTVARA